MSQITTFYSYKGGSGRSMTMANVAWALATNGERVLAIDWDLEAPGLHRYFHPFLKDPEQATSAGLIDRIWSYVESLGDAGKAEHGRATRFALASCDDIVQPLDLPTRSKGCLHFLGAGRQDDQYSAKVGGLDWARFYGRFDGEAFIDRLMGWARGRYTHILIDSRTGVADTAGICTAQLPDVVVVCLVYNRQSIEGSAAVARSIGNARVAREQGPLNIRFIPCRVEERGVVEAARRYAAARLSAAFGGSQEVVERQLRRDEVRHYPWCAFEEKLAVFEDVPDERGSLLDAMHELARQLADRKQVRIENIEPKLLSSIWRRVAFGDPRLADLETLDEASVDEAYTRLLPWVDAALEDEDERPDWLMALGEAAVSYGSRAMDRHASGAAEFLGRSGLRIANRAMDADPAEYTVRFALLLQSRAAQLQKSRQYDEGIDLAGHSHRLLLRQGTPINTWRAARSLERKAELCFAKDEADRGITCYREAADLYSSINRRELPLGAALDPARSFRVLAEGLLAHGDPHEAEAMAEQAVRLLGKAGGLQNRRDAAEAVNVLATRAEIAAFVGADAAEREIMRVRIRAKDSIESVTLRNQLERRLHVAEARLRMRSGEFDRALALLDDATRLATEGGSRSLDILELRVAVLLEAKREAEAANLLLEALRNDELIMTGGLAELMLRAFSATGREEDFTLAMLQVLGESKEQRPALLSVAAKWLNSRQSGPADPDRDWMRSITNRMLHGLPSPTKQEEDRE